MANQSAENRHYGSVETIQQQYLTLRERFQGMPCADKKNMSHADKWLKFCSNKDLTEGLQEIVHFALCCFEATAESIGSVINEYGRKQRYSLLPSSLGDEIQIAWNGPQIFSTAATSMIKGAMERYFQRHRADKKPRFYESSKAHIQHCSVRF